MVLYRLLSILICLQLITGIESQNTYQYTNKSPKSNGRIAGIKLHGNCSHNTAAKCSKAKKSCLKTLKILLTIYRIFSSLFHTKAVNDFIQEGGTNIVKEENGNEAIRMLQGVDHNDQLSDRGHQPKEDKVEFSPFNDLTVDDETVNYLEDPWAHGNTYVLLQRRWLD